MLTLAGDIPGCVDVDLISAGGAKVGAIVFPPLGLLARFTRGFDGLKDKVFSDAGVRSVLDERFRLGTGTGVGEASDGVREPGCGSTSRSPRFRFF